MHQLIWLPIFTTGKDGLQECNRSVSIFFFMEGEGVIVKMIHFDHTFQQGILAPLKIRHWLYLSTPFCFPICFKIVNDRHFARHVFLYGKKALILTCYELHAPDADMAPEKSCSILQNWTRFVKSFSTIFIGWRWKIESWKVESEKKESWKSAYHFL